MAVLIGMSGAFKGRKYDLDQDEVHIGRHTTNTICLEDPSVSGRHCVIAREERKYTVTDLESTNGTRLNGTPVTSARLKPKDILQIGSVELMFDGTDVDVEEEPAPPALAEEPVGVAAEPVGMPESFGAASPFGKRQDSRKPWAVATALIGLLILVALVFFLMQLYRR